MASFLIPNSATPTRSRPATLSSAFFRPRLLETPPAVRLPGRRKRSSRGLTMVTRAGPSTTTYVYAFVLPLSLLAVTIFTSIRIGDKLEVDFFEEALNFINKLELEFFKEHFKNELIRMAEELEEEEEEGGAGGGGGEDEGSDVSLMMELPDPALQQTRTRDRPKKEA